MDARIERLAKALEVEQADAAALVAAGLDTPRKVKVLADADLEKLIGPKLAAQAKAKFKQKK